MSELAYASGRMRSPQHLGPCPECKSGTINRVHGVWCRRCRGWIVEYVDAYGDRGAFVKNGMIGR
jgi:hypothetical protein